jgi:hypothetical protein
VDGGRGDGGDEEKGYAKRPPQPELFLSAAKRSETDRHRKLNTDRATVISGCPRNHRLVFTAAEEEPQARRLRSDFDIAQQGTEPYVNATTCLCSAECALKKLSWLRELDFFFSSLAVKSLRRRSLRFVAVCSSHRFRRCCQGRERRRNQPSPRVRALAGSRILGFTTALYRQGIKAICCPSRTSEATLLLRTDGTIGIYHNQT